jgi:two-component system, NtrC family, sensor kinase
MAKRRDEEESASELRRKVTLLTRELDEAHEQQAATADVLKVINGSTFDLDAVLTTVIRSGIKLCDATRGVIWLKRGQQLYLAAHVGYSDEWVNFAESNPITPAADALTTSGLAAFTGQVVHVEDVPNDPRFRSLAAHKLGDYRAGIAVPLKRDAEIIGVISLSRPEARLFAERQVALLQTFADQAGIAIENTRIFRELESRNHEITEALDQQTATSNILGVIASSPGDVTPVLEAIAESAARLCQAFDAIVRLREGDFLIFGAHFGPIPVDPKAWAISRKWTGGRSVVDRTTIHVHDLADAVEEFPEGWAMARRFGHRTTLAVPLLREGEAIGTMMLRRIEVQPFTAAQISLLRTFADQAVIAIENARLFQEVQARNRELSETLEQQMATSAILKAIAASPTDIQPVLEAVTESAAQLCDGYDTTIFLRRGDALGVVAHRGPIRVDFAELPIRRDIVTSRAVLDRMPIHVHDLAAAGDEYPTGQKLARQMGFHTVLSTPLLRKGEAIGALMIRRTEVRPFSDRQVELLKTFADQAVIAIENAHLFEEVRARNRELSETLEQQFATSAILRAIAASPTDIQPVLRAVAENAARLCGAYDTTIFLRRGEALAVVAHDGKIPLDFAEWPITRDFVAGRAVLDRESIHVPDVTAAESEFPDSRMLGLRLGIRTMLATPLLREGDAIGAVVIRRAEMNPFSERQIELLKTFADQAVIAIENVRLFEEVQARTAELGEALQQQTATADVLKVISRSAFDVQTVLDTLAASAARLCEADIVDFYRLVDDGFQWAASFGTEAEADRRHTTIKREPGRGSASGRVLLESKTVHIPDWEADAEFTFVDVARKRGVRAILGVPLLRGDEPIGLLLVMRRLPGPFSTKQIELAETFADQAVIAIENVRLFGEVQARNRDLTESLERQTAMSDILRVISRSPTDVQPVFETIAESAARLCGGHFCTVFRFDGELIHFVAQHGLPSEGVEEQRRAFPKLPGRGSGASRAIRSATVEQIPDVNADPDYEVGETARAIGARSVLAVPMLRDGRPVGSINIGRTEPGYFPPRQVELLQTFADQAVIAIENVRLFEEVQARTAELSEALQQQTATADVLKVISRSAFDLQPVFQALIDSAARLCGADMGAISLRQGDSLRFMAGSGQSPKLHAYERTHPHPIGRGTFQGRAAVEGRTIHVPDVLQDAEYERPEAAMLGDFRAVLSVPLRRGEEIIGVFGLARRTVGPFATRQIELVETFADQAVIAIENVRLFEEVQARTAELSESLQQQTATADVLKVISRSAFDLRAVLNTLIASACQLCNAEMGLIFLARDGSFAPEAGHGTPPGYLEFVRTHPIKPGRETFTGRAALTKAVVNVADALEDKEFTFSEARDRASYRAMLAVPLLRQGEVIGVFAMPRRAPGAFSDKQVELVQTFADQAVIAIENVRLFNEVQAKTRDLEESLTFQKATNDVLEVIGRSASVLDPVLTAIVDTASTLCRADMAVIRLLRDGALHHAAASSGMDSRVASYASSHNAFAIDRSTISGRVVLEGKTIHVEDAAADPEYTFFRDLPGAPVRTMLGVPLLRDAKVVGAIIMWRTSVDLFTERQIALVQTFADQAVIAIQNVRLFEEVQARTAELSEALQQQTATADVLKVISRSAFDLQTVLDSLVESAARVCEAEAGVIFQREGDVYHFAASFGFTAEFKNYARANPHPAGRDSLTGRAALERKTVQVVDVLADPDYEAAGYQERSGFRTGLGVPLLRQGLPIGVFVLTRAVVRPFSEKQIELVETFADQAVIAIENARLFNEVKQRTDELSRSLEELQTAQDRLVQTEKLASLGQLTAGIAHEIKNPLNFVNNFSALSAELIGELQELLSRAALDGKMKAEVEELSNMLKGNLDKVTQHGKRADSIVKNMLLHSRQGSGEHRPSDINAIVEESLNLAYHGARAENKGFNITLEKSLDPEAGKVDVYAQEITRVLINLISNGFYATAKRHAESNGAAYEPVLAAATRNLGGNVEIRIRDNGTGIPPEVKEKMFNPFFTTKPAGEGTGLGLSLSHDIIVKQHAGTINVESVPGAYTEFRIVLPRSAATLGKSGENA